MQIQSNPSRYDALRVDVRYELQQAIRLSRSLYLAPSGAERKKEEERERERRVGLKQS